MRSPLFALSLSLSLAALFTAPAAAADLTPSAVWKTDFAAAEAQARSLNCPLVVHVQATWCGPCKQMEREVLDTAGVLQSLDAGFVAVKVDFNASPKVIARFKIEKVPTDLILSPEGKVLYRNEGYVAASKYLAKLNHIDAQYAKVGKRSTRSEKAVADNAKSEKDKPAAVANNAPTSKTTPPAVSATTADKLVPPPMEPKKIAAAAKPAPPVRTGDTENKLDVPVATESIPSGTAGTLLAMEGYCPVTLRMTRSWKPGSNDITLEYDGLTFYFTAPEKRDEFQANPGKFAPRLKGCDPVALAKSDLAVRGSVKFGAFYEGELFLFESADNRATFRKDPVKFARLQHTLKPEEVKKIASAVGQ